MKTGVSWRIGIVAMCTGVLAVAACATGGDGDGASSPAATSVTSASAAPSRLVGPAEFAAAVAEPARVTINVHVPFEGDVPGTDLSIPFDQITQQAGKLPVDRRAPLAIYCRSGPMSARAATELVALGYTDIVELNGGMKLWQDSGRPLLGQ